MRRAAGRRAVAAGACAALALSSASGCGGTSLLLDGRHDLGVVPLETRLVRIGDGGSDVDGPIVLARDHGAVVFVNDTRDRPVAVLVSGVLCTLGCSHTRGFVAGDGSTYTPEPLAPGAAASLCVHAAGEFAFRVDGVDPPVEGTLLVTHAAATTAPAASTGGAR